jgi:hypothetical protein
MGWPTGRHTWRGRSSFLSFNLLLVALLAASPLWGQPTGPSNVDDCHPCSFAPGEHLPKYSFTFDLQVAGSGRVINGIEVAREGSTHTVQHLPVTGMGPVAAGEPFFFGGVDINFDGLLDLMLITRRGVANAYAMYWIFNPNTGLFDSLGTYPVFRIDAQRKRLSTYERGGAAGLIHTAKEYEFEDGKLSLVRKETQQSTKRPNVFRRVIRQRVDGAMKVTDVQMVRAPN